MSGTSVLTGRRGRPPKISAEQIIDKALELAVDDLSIAAVARELGVAAPAIYRYFDSREALQAAILARVLEGSVLEESAGWRDYLLAYAAELESVLGRYPSLIGVNAAQNWDVLGALVAPLMNGALNRMLPAGFTPKEAFSVMNAVTHLVHAAARSRVVFESMPEPPSFEGIDAGPDTAAVIHVLQAGPSADIRDSVSLRCLLDGAASLVEGRP